MKQGYIRNFSIIAHIDHGKSTLADRLLELTGTIEKRRMREQVLDVMDLERERGITIKMAPVTMNYKLKANSYKLNLIDTPGHIDFSYEVSRALSAVEGAVLLVDATQGVQAQTLTTLEMARELGLVIVPALSKVDAAHARVEEVRAEVAALLGISEEEVLTTSGKTGEGIQELLDAIVLRIPAPSEDTQSDILKGLVFDFQYSDHRGVVVFIRVVQGVVRRTEQLFFCASKKRFSALEVGVLGPAQIKKEELSAGEIGYIVTGVKKADVASVGDTVTKANNPAPALPGYKKPAPVVWASLYPESQDDFVPLKQALGRLSLEDASFSFEEESSGALGRGFRCGFLGMLHLEIITERLRREFNLSLVVTTPSVTYEVFYAGGKRELIYTPSRFPNEGDAQRILEPWVAACIITPQRFLGSVTQLLFQHEGTVEDTETFGADRVALTASMPLRELMRGFFDRLKSVSSGFASISYELSDTREADVVRLDLYVAEEIVPAFSRLVARKRMEEESKGMVERLHGVLPRQLFATKIQARALGRIISSKTLPALRKNVTGHLYGGDVTRKMKLLEKQKKGKKRMQARGKVTIPHDVFLKMVRGDS